MPNTTAAMARSSYLLAGGTPYRDLGREHRLSNLESKLLAYCTTKIDPKDPLRKFRVTYSEFWRFFGALASGPETMSVFMKAALSLMKKKLMLPVPGAKRDTDRQVARWFGEMIFDEDWGWIDVAFSPAVAEALLYSSTAFQYPATNLTRLSGNYSIPLYEFILSMQNMLPCSSITLSVGELCQVVGELYTTPQDLMSNAVGPACQEISRYTDILVIPVISRHTGDATLPVELQIRHRQ